MGEGTDGISGAWRPGRATKTGAAWVPPVNWMKDRPVMPCGWSDAIVSVLIGVPGRKASVTWMRSTLPGSIEISCTVPTGTPR